MLLDRNRVAKLVELTAWERSLRGPERMIREEDVALLIKAAYADATEESRAAFMAKVSKYPTSAWPWSSVQAVPMTPNPRRRWHNGHRGQSGPGRPIDASAADPDSGTSGVGRRRSRQPAPCSWRR
jgi:hypothetical protein